MFMSDNRVVDLGIYWTYCILRHQILTERVFGGHDYLAKEDSARSDMVPRAHRPRAVGGEWAAAAGSRSEDC